MRHTISFESGANDELAFPFVVLVMLLIEQPQHAWRTWVSDKLLLETGGGIAFGLLLGFLFGKMLEFCIKKGYTAKPAILAFALSVAFFTLSALEMIHVNSILAVFAAGLMLRRFLGKQEDIEEEQVQEMMARLFTIPVFVFFGLILPWQQWMDLGWSAPALVVLVLLFRRLPVLMLCKPLMRGYDTKSLAFMGWFGPIGAAALYYCFYCYKRLHTTDIWTLTSLLVFSSIVIYGVTASPLLKLYGEMKQRSSAEIYP